MNSLKNHRHTFVHTGIISKIKHDSVVVTLEQNINCESCHVKGTCGISESSQKKVEVTNSNDVFRINEQVNVVLKKTLGLKAVFWAYVFPFILSFSTLIITSVFLEEWLAGLLSLSILIPYYIALNFLNTSLKKVFKISVLKT